MGQEVREMHNQVDLDHYFCSNSEGLYEEVLLLSRQAGPTPDLSITDHFPVR